MIQQTIRILIIEDDIDYVDIVRMCLDEPDSMDMRFELERADRLELGLKLLENGRFDALLLDLQLPDSRGLETVAQVLAKVPEMPILVMTSQGDEATAFEAMRLGAQDYMVKSTSDSRLIKRAIWYAIERRKILTLSDNIIKGSADGMVVVDKAGVVAYLNPTAEALLGVAPGGMTGRPFPFPLSAGQATQHKLEPPSGEPKTIEIRVTQIRWKDSPALLASLRDITELQRIEQLKAEVKERRKIDKLKDELLATVSHELRTPLTILKGAVDNLDEGIAGPLSSKQAEVVGLAKRNLARLSKMINGLLGLSRLESGRARPNRRVLAVAPLVQEALRLFKPLTGERGLALQPELPDELPEVFIDPEMISEVLNNLLDNALRFAKSRIVLRASASPPSSGRRCVSVEIIDDGPGIPPERIGDLFNKFVQVDRSSGGGGYKGTGLGLAICKEIMALHDSQIRVESRPGAATRFTIVLPCSGASSTSPSVGQAS